jgi:hypothetical protein
VLQRLGTRLLLTYLTVTARLTGPSRRGRDRGEGLAWAALAVGGLAIVAIVVFILKDKATTIARNICTDADPTNCQ